jgi:dienelactone hydrolase
MAEVLLFHHAQGRTPGVVAFANVLRASGHTVHTPDLYDGRLFETLAEGVAYASAVGFSTLLERGRAAADDLPDELVYAGFSLGVMPAQLHAQSRPGARGALLFHSCVPVSEFGDRWPSGLPLQIHAMEGDEFFTTEGDLDAAEALVASSPDAELFLYAGDRHLFADVSLDSYDKDATDLLTERVLALLDEVS